MKVGDTVFYMGQKGVISWAAERFIDVRFENMSPIAHEQLAREATVVATQRPGNAVIFTLGRASRIILRLTGQSEIKCSCGGDSIGASKHIYYCDKYVPM